MIRNLIEALFYGFTFYIIYSRLYRVSEVKKHIKKSTLDSTYSESYKLMYSNYLKGNCIVTSIMIGIINLSQRYSNIGVSLAIGIIIGLCIKYTTLQENLTR